MGHPRAIAVVPAGALVALLGLLALSASSFAAPGQTQAEPPAGKQRAPRVVHRADALRNEDGSYSAAKLVVPDPARPELFHLLEHFLDVPADFRLRVTTTRKGQVATRTLSQTGSGAEHVDTTFFPLPDGRTFGFTHYGVGTTTSAVPFIVSKNGRQVTVVSRERAMKLNEQAEAHAKNVSRRPSSGASLAQYLGDLGVGLELPEGARRTVRKGATGLPELIWRWTVRSSPSADAPPTVHRARVRYFAQLSDGWLLGQSQHTETTGGPGPLPDKLTTNPSTYFAISPAGRKVVLLDATQATKLAALGHMPRTAKHRNVLATTGRARILQRMSNQDVRQQARSRKAGTIDVRP
ncbi:MAG: hypothetical protein IT371_00395 [Deltaproteobacteria bacterium]|nr:hypothetical protein [Deltaproteobacteria bacterium]